MLTTEVKSALRTTIRELRTQLLRDLANQLERTYQLGVAADKAKLAAEQAERRKRLEAWIDERVRASGATKRDEIKKARKRFQDAVVKEAAYTLLNRIVVLRILEEDGHIKPAVITGGWASRGYQDFLAFAPALGNVSEDETEGYATLLRLVMDEWALDMPGLFEDVGVSRLVEIPAATLRDVVQRLDDTLLEPAWRDDTTLGWVYQFWNDPDRKAIDERLKARLKVQPHEIASKTQMFTERYMVEWLLQNILGSLWLAICTKNGWVAEATPTLAGLEDRRVAWRTKLRSGEVAAEEIMPVAEGLEDRWKYYVARQLPDRVLETAPASIRDLKLLDPACGSGHFLVIAFDLLAALYKEEARHAGVSLSDTEIARSILEENLFGVDIDPRAVQIAAASLVLKAKRLSPTVRPRRINLVAPVFDVAGLSKEDPSRVALRDRLERESGISATATDNLIDNLAEVGHLGTLLRVGKAVEFAMMTAKDGSEDTGRQVDAALEEFLAAHTSEADLGLRLDGEQLAAGVRFIRLIREGTFDVVVGNPPYQSTKKMASADYVASQYARGKADLFAAFLERGLELVREGGLSGMVTMRVWTSLAQFEALRKHFVSKFHLTNLADLGWAAFEEMADSPIAMSILARCPPGVSLAQCPTHPTARDRTDTHRARVAAGLLTQVGCYEFDPGTLNVIDGQPLIYWWTAEFLARYERTPKLGSTSPAQAGTQTSNDLRFIRRPWEVSRQEIFVRRVDLGVRTDGARLEGDCHWVPIVPGAAGRMWCEPLSAIIRWRYRGAELFMSDAAYPRNTHRYFHPGLSFPKIGAAFSARMHRFRSIAGDAAPSVYPADLEGVLCLLNSSEGRQVLEALNPSVNFTSADVDRLPIFPISGAKEIIGRINNAFAEHERAREASIEFLRPAQSCWSYAQDWAQRAVDRAEGEPLPRWNPRYIGADPRAPVSFAVGVALGRFGGAGEGLLDDAPGTALPAGILWLSAATDRDSLEAPACVPLVAAWEEHGGAIAPRNDLRTWLRTSFFKWHKHKDRYDSRPPYLPVSSARKTFVAWISVHRWRVDTLSVLLADHLMPERVRIQGELDDVLAAVSRGKASQKIERRSAELQEHLAELDDFIANVREVAELGPPQPDAKTPRRCADARFEMDLDDGVMVNSAALWSLLEPQWTKPKQWWKELALSEGKKDYDWSHLAARYFPERVAAKCENDPSLAVGHGCFWRLHPALAYAWELRLQDEIGADFTIDEEGSEIARAAFLREHPEDAAAIEQTEEQRRRRKASKAQSEAGQGQLDLGSDDGDDDREEADDD